MAEASGSPSPGARDPPNSSSSAPAPSTPIPDGTEEPPVSASKSRRRRGKKKKKKKKNARSSSTRDIGSDTESPTTLQAQDSTQLADASSSLGVEAQEEQEEREPPPAPPPSPISHGQWSPPLPPLGKLQGKVVIEPNKAIAAQFAQTYSDRRSDASILPIFTDGSASYIINNDAKDRFCSASTVFRAHPTSDAWIERGYPLLLATDSLNAEVFGLGRGLRDGRDYVRAHPEMGIRTLLVFTDVMKFLEMLPRIEAGEWDVVKRGYVEEFLALDAELAGEMGVSVEYHWVPGHSGVEGNYRADRASRRCRPDVMYPHVFQTLPFPSREEQLLNQQAKLERKRKHEEDVSRAMSKRSKKRAREEEET